MDKAALKKFKRMLTNAATMAAKISAARKALAVDCTHPPEFVTPHIRTRGDGYGGERTYHYNHCSICRKIQAVWHDGVTTQTWFDESKMSRDDD